MLSALLMVGCADDLDFEVGSSVGGAGSAGLGGSPGMGGRAGGAGAGGGGVAHGGAAGAGAGGAGQGAEGGASAGSGSGGVAGGGLAGQGAGGQSGSTGGSDGVAGAGGLGEAGAGGMGGAVGAHCPPRQQPRVSGYVQVSELSEGSGLVASRHNAGMLWTHNDSGGAARLYAITTSGVWRGSLVLRDVAATDWEDIARGPGPNEDADYLYVGDIGDNSARRGSVVVYRVLEPRVPIGTPPVTLNAAADTLLFQYPDGQARNAETLLVDPQTEDLYIVTKSSLGLSLVFRATAPHVPGPPRALELRGSLSFVQAPLSGTTLTGGDIAADGSAIVLRTETTAYIWDRLPGSSVDEALKGPPCVVPISSHESNGEAIAFAPTGTSYYTLGEGTSPPLFYSEASF